MKREQTNARAQTHARSFIVPDTITSTNSYIDGEEMYIWNKYETDSV